MAKELCSRRVDTVKGAHIRLVVERKVDMKARIGKSPDISDAAMILVDLVRERLRGKVGKASAAPVPGASSWMKLARKHNLGSEFVLYTD